MKFSIKDFFSKCDQIRSFLQFCAVCAGLVALTAGDDVAAFHGSFLDFVLEVPKIVVQVVVAIYINLR